MENVKETENTHQPYTRTGGKKKLAAERRRVILSTRVLPSTREWLESFNCNNLGRAIDKIAIAMKRPEIVRMVDAGSDIRQVAG